MCLGHVVGSKVTRAYKRGDLLAERRALLDAWADYALGAVTMAIPISPSKSVVL
jgi:hypothetical protein